MGTWVRPSKAFCVLVRVAVFQLFSLPKAEPCQSLVPDLVRMLTTEPELRLYSTPKLLVVTWYSCTQSVLPIKRPGPATELSLLFCPSICWSLLRPLIPFELKPT